MTDANASPTLECDLVMKGGVTSGVVYPAAIAAIARDYRLRSIGGTSAGAIAAAAAAAMEFGRRSGRNPGAPIAIASLAAALGEPDREHIALLRRLMEPDPATARLFRLLIHAVAGQRATLAWTMLRGPAIVALLVAAALAAGLAGAMETDSLALRLSAAALVLTFGIPVLTGIFAAVHWLPRLNADLAAAAANGFGLCSGMARHRMTPRRRWPWQGRPAAIEQPALTEWLHARLQELAGLDTDDVVTFGDLWAAADRVAGTSREQAFASAIARSAVPGRHPPPLAEVRRDIDLALVASDINRGQSVQLPFMRREDRLYARRSDLAALFPSAVVRWMVDHRRGDDADATTLIADPEERADFIRLPLPEDLPILFGVRLSMSFPFLLRAVRLYVVRRSAAAPGAQELAEIWLTDGGITSNFPIHLFDAPIPARPTFCLNLLDPDDELEPDPGRSAGRTDAVPPPSPAAGGAGDDLVYMLRTNNGRLSPYARLLGGSATDRLLRFAGRIAATARQWGDNQLLDVPGYRDRIVHVRMRPDEGGFNFAMDAAKIADLEARGARAGAAIAERFRPDATHDPLHPDERSTLNWANHRFARFRSFLAGLEAAATRFAAIWEIDRARTEHPVGDTRHTFPSIEQMIDEARPGKDPFPQRVGYPFRSNAQADGAHELVKALNALHAVADDPGWRGVDLHNGEPTSPRPKPALNLRPPTATDPLAERP